MFTKWLLLTTKSQRVGEVEGERVCEESEVEDALAVEGETGDCCVIESEGASSEEEEGSFYCYGGCSGDGGCVEFEGRVVFGEVKEDGGDLICGVVDDGEGRDCERALCLLEEGRRGRRIW